MLSLKHFEEFCKDKSGTNWQTLIDKGIVVKCKTCGKWIWSMWYAGKGKNTKHYDKPVDKCALCFDWKKFN